MRRCLLLALVAALAVTGCATSGDSFGDIGSSVRGGFGQDTRGTNRRPDVDYGFTRPSIPTVTNR